MPETLCNAQAGDDGCTAGWAPAIWEQHASSKALVWGASLVHPADFLKDPQLFQVKREQLDGTPSTQSARLLLQSVGRDCVYLEVAIPELVGGAGFLPDGSHVDLDWCTCNLFHSVEFVDQLRQHPRHRIFEYAYEVSTLR